MPSLMGPCPQGLMLEHQVGSRPSEALLGVGEHLLLVAGCGHSLHVRTEEKLLRTKCPYNASRPSRRPEDSEDSIKQG